MPYQIDDIIQVKVMTQLGFQAGYNLLHWRVTAIAGSPVTEADAATDFEALIAPVIKPLINQAATYQGIVLQTVHPFLTLGSLATAGAGVGTGGASPMPGQVAGIITKQSALAGRANRGRVYIPFPAEEDNATTNLPSVGYQAAGANYGNAIETINLVTGADGGTATFTPVIFRRGNPTFSSTLINCRMNVKWATQRSRGSYGRPNI